jgi:hypothetical protein
METPTDGGRTTMPDMDIPKMTLPRLRGGRAFLGNLSKTGNVSIAAAAAKVARANVYATRRRHEVFAKAMDSAREVAADLLEAEALVRATVGVEEPVYQDGKLVGTVRRPSDTLLIALLKAARPDKYATRYITRVLPGDRGGGVAEALRGLLDHAAGGTDGNGSHEDERSD